jgi:RNA polymerase sigma factor (sigma-70 family)
LTGIGRSDIIIFDRRRSMTLRGFDDDVARAAFKIAVKTDQVDDFKQEGMIAANRAFNRYKSTLKGLELRKAMMRSATNAMRSWQRKMVRLGSAVQPTVEPQYEKTTDRVEIGDVIEAATKTLPSDDQQQCAAVFCYNYGEITAAEAARIVGCSRATASRALSNFKTEFKKLWMPPPKEQDAEVQKV